MRLRMNRVKIRLDTFKPRDYQKPIIDALENKGYKRIICVWPRRAGKDLLAFNIVIRAALKRVGIYYYVFPTFSSGRRILWEAITNDGFRVLDYIPKELILRKNESTMFVELYNGSLIKIIGSDNYDKTLVGTNVCGVVFSEYAIAKRESWDLAARPILANNDGFAIFVSTPRGKNHLYDLYVLAQDNPDHWYTSVLTVEDTGHMTPEKLAIEKNEMSHDMFLQEYMCSFDAGSVGAIYSDYINQARLDGRVGFIPWDSSQKVYTAWDIGMDTTSIVFFQVIRSAVYVIDYWEDKNKNMHECVKEVLNKDYLYGRHFFPHDGRNRSWEATDKFSRKFKAEQLGLKPLTLIDTPSLDDSIENTRLSFSKISIDEQKCKQLIKALDNYRRDWDATKRLYSKPVHNWASHPSSAFMIMCLSLNKLGNSMTQEQIDKDYYDAMRERGGFDTQLFR